MNSFRPLEDVLELNSRNCRLLEQDAEAKCSFIRNKSNSTIKL